MVQDANSKVIITQTAYVEKFSNCGATIINFDDDSHIEIIENQEGCYLNRAPDSDHMAYVIYTSGTTGNPKGVCNIHRGLVNRLWWMQDKYRLSLRDSVLQKTPYNFDVSVWEFFWPIITGAKLVVAPPEAHKDPRELARLIRHYEITTIHFVPSMLGIFLEEPEAVFCKSLRYVIASGEALPFALQEKFYEVLENAELHNLYGPTEAAIDVSYWHCIKNHPLGFVPIGKPISNMQLYILDEQMRPVSDGNIGELYIGGDGLARGYLNRPSLTEERFIKNPLKGTPSVRLYKTGDLATFLSDGNIKYIGRSDHQVKIHGIRIELQEIENVINRYPGIKRSIVVAKEDAMGTKRLVSYVLLEDNNTYDSNALLIFLKSKLPSYMIPNAFTKIDHVPTTVNGKINLQALPNPEFTFTASSKTAVLPRNEMELTISKIWEAVLGVKEICVLATFNEVGGDSIRAIQVLQKIRSAGYSLTLSDFIKYSTIESVAQYLMSKLGSVNSQNCDISELLVSETVKQLLDSESEEDIYQASHMQKFMLDHYRGVPGAFGIYHYQQCLSIFDDNFQPRLFIEAIKSQVFLNHNFRLYFSKVTDQEIYQVVRKKIKEPVVYYDLQNHSGEVQDKIIEDSMLVDRELPFDPWNKNENLVRFSVFQKSHDHFDFLMSIHHAIYDGWSNMEFLRELFHEYHVRKSDHMVASVPKRNVHKEFVGLEQEMSASLMVETFWNQYLGQDLEKIEIQNLPSLRSKTVLEIPRIDRYVTYSLLFA